LTIVVPPESMKRSLAEAVEDYSAQLIGSPAEEYLIQDRGLSSEVLESFQIGFVGKAHLGDDLFRGMISFPFMTVSGPVAIQFRQVGDYEPRFRSKGSTKRIFNPSVLLEPHRRVYICEGLVDTLTVADVSLPVVGFPGVDAWDKPFARAFRNRRVVVLADGDDKGQGLKFATRIQVDVEQCDVILFEGEDVNSYRMKYGVDALKEKMGVR
jgi:DNA primase